MYVSCMKSKAGEDNKVKDVYYIIERGRKREQDKQKERIKEP